MEMTIFARTFILCSSINRITLRNSARSRHRLASPLPLLLILSAQSRHLHTDEQEERGLPQWRVPAPRPRLTYCLYSGLIGRCVLQTEHLGGDEIAATSVLVMLSGLNTAVCSTEHIGRRRHRPVGSLWWEMSKVYPR